MTVAPLGDVGDFVRGVTFKPADVVPDGVPVMATKAVQKTLVTTGASRIPAGLVKRSEQFLREGDTLVSTANSWNLVGKCCWVPQLREPSAIGGFVAVLRPKPGVEPRYLYHWFASPAIQASVRGFGSQTTNIANLNLARCREMPIPLPAIEEQRRIADILDRADALRVKRREALALLDDLTQSIFLDTFGDPESSPWLAELGSVVRPASGSTPSRNDLDNFGGPIHWVKTTEVSGGLITTTGENVTEKGAAEARLRVYPKGSIIVAMYGQGRTRGQVAMLGVPAATNQACAVLPPGDYNSQFMFMQLKLAYERLRSMARGGNQANLNLQLVSSLSVIAPPLDLQEHFAARAVGIDRLRGVAMEHVQGTEAMFASLQRRAFAGRL